MDHPPGATGTALAARLRPEDVDALAEAAAAGEATAEQLALLGAHRDLWQESLEYLLAETDAQLERVRTLPGPERWQVVTDFEAERDRLAAALARLLAGEGGADEAPPLPPDEVRLHASWARGQVVVWAAAPAAAPLAREELPHLLEAADAPAGGWVKHPPVSLPSGAGAPALSTPVGDALGWLVAVGAGEVHGATGELGSSLRWLGRVAVWAVDLVARGALVPSLRSHSRSRRRLEPGRSEYSVRWVPALVDEARAERLAATMPAAVAAVPPVAEPRAVVLSALGSMVDAIATGAASRMEFPAPPPDPRTPAAVGEALLYRLGGARFEAPIRTTDPLAKRLERWAQPVTQGGHGGLVVQLDPPDRGGAWHLSVLGPDPDGSLVPIEVALLDGTSRRRLADELERLERLLPVLMRPGGRRRGEVVLSQDEAWELMTETGPVLRSAGFDVRVPALSRQRPSPALRLVAEAAGESVVGASQLANVRWSAVFDDVELTAADISRLAAQARPLVRSRGRWVELDKADLNEAAAALAERASTKQLTGAEVLRHALGLEGSPLAGGITVEGSGWAAELLAKADSATSAPVDTPPGFVGELRSYQRESLGWLGFLDAVELGGCLALDMGLGKTPTVLAHLVRTQGRGPALVVAPPAVVGNWAAEAARFTPELRVVVHHGSTRASAEDLAREVDGADVLITTYGTGVRDVEALATIAWDRMILDEAQAIKNPANETARQLRRIDARSRIALTGTPIENGLGDLWSILDFTNPGLVGGRAAFVAQLSGDGTGERRGPEHALRALNGILVFRRTKSEPEVAKELPERIDQLDHCTMTPEQIGLYQAVLDRLIASADGDGERRQGEILAAITALKQICNHPAAYQDDDLALEGRSGKLSRLEEIVDAVFEAGERALVFTHFAEWGKKLADHLAKRTGTPVACYHGGLARGVRDRIIADFQSGEGPGVLVLSLKAGGTGLNLTAASHVVLYDRWWNPAVEDQARDRAWRIGQTRTVVSHRLVCPGTVDERVEEVVAGKRKIADLVLPKSSSLADLDRDQLRVALGLRPDTLLTDEDGGGDPPGPEQEAA
ncbi:MAG: DEAD/DEAH box helicase [Actinobacteria bacterium]|nr:DEAD/DEAH box helicase [Actinomycetota bacterium]